MSATLEQLVRVQSALKKEVMTYLESLVTQTSQLPKYYPDHLRQSDNGKTGFDNLRQMVQVVEDRSTFEQWLAKERERLRAAGQEIEQIAYIRARPENEEEPEQDRHDRAAQPPHPIPWDERAGNRFKRAVILGDPGFGKTWLLQYEARRLARIGAEQLRDQTIGLNDLTLPISARLPNVNQTDDPVEDALSALVSDGLPKVLSDGYSKAFHEFVRRKLETDRCVVLLDAWDEVPVEKPKAGEPISYKPCCQQRLGQRLENFASRFPHTRILLTSRIVGYLSTPIPGMQELELLAFDWRQIESFVHVWFGDNTDSARQFLNKIRQNSHVRGLARIPLMLAFQCRACPQGDFPTRRSELYERCLWGLLRDWKEEKQHRPISDIEVRHVLSCLSKAALALFVSQKEQFTETELAEKSGFDLDGDIDRAQAFVESLKRDGILITAGEHLNGPLLMFLHRTFHT